MPRPCTTTAGVGSGRRSTAPQDADGAGPEDYEERTASYRRFMREVIGAERQTLRRLRDEGAITDEVRRRIEFDLDLEETRLRG